MHFLSHCGRFRDKNGRELQVEYIETHLLGIVILYMTGMYLYNWRQNTKWWEWFREQGS